MAEWYNTEIEFTGRKPTADEAATLHEALFAVDYDAPQVTDVGIQSSWRAPRLDVEDTCDLLHWLGFPCRGRSVRDDEHAYMRPLSLEPWFPSTDRFPPRVSAADRALVMGAACYGGLMVPDEVYGLVRKLP